MKGSSDMNARLYTAASRRRLAVRICGAVLVLASLQGCSGDAPREDPPRTIKIGFVTPLTGPGASFGDVDTFVIDQVRSHFDQEGITVAGKKYKVQILVRDNASSSMHEPDGGMEDDDPTALGSQAALDLIQDDGVDLILAS